MKKALIAPSHYVQGENALSDLAKYVANYGKKALIVSSEVDFGRVKEAVEGSFNQAPDLSFVNAGFNLECCEPEIERLRKLVRENGCDVIVGIGGGKSLDTAKTVCSL